MATGLNGWTALVTGCGREQGLGHAIALALADAGADVAVSDRASRGVKNAAESRLDADDWLGLDSVVAAIAARGRRAHAVIGDVGDAVDAQRMVDEAIEALGRVDILVNNAAAPHGADRTWAWEVPEDAYDAVMKVNTKGAFLMSTAVARHLLAREAPGRIINIASLAGRIGVARRAVYSASKFAMIGLTQSMAQELAAHRVTVNAVCPGPMKTARNVSTSVEVAEGSSTDHLRAMTTGHTPVGRIGLPHDIARTVVFLADQEADFITGETISVGGGAGML